MEKPENLTKTELRDKRLKELLNSCQDQILQEIIGPFGLTPAMFADQDGGNVTTLHNFKQGVVATEEDQKRYDVWNNEKYDRRDYDKDLQSKRKELFQKEEAPVSSLTGKELPRDGRTHLDHNIAAKRIEKDPSSNLFMNKEQRVKMANDQKNLVPLESNINQSLQDKDKRIWADIERKKDRGKTNAETYGVDRKLLNETVRTAEKHVDQTVLLAKLKKQGTELAITGVKEAGRNAIRQALGVAIHTFVSGAFIELKFIMKDPNRGNLADDIVSAMKRVLIRVKAKLKDILNEGLSGLIQGFVSNLVTFLINNIITTVAKVVTVIREGMKGLWRAVKMLINPPPGMSAIEVTREVTKIFAAVVTTSLGMMFEEAIKGFLSGIPLLLPLIDVLAPAVTAILTGIATALIVYGLDRFFDWLSSSGTEFLKAIESNLDETRLNIETMCTWIESQFQSSVEYIEIRQNYYLIEENLVKVHENQLELSQLQSMWISTNNQFNEKLSGLIAFQNEKEHALMEKLEEYLNKENK